MTLTTAGRWRILIVGFLGWLCAGMHMSITQLTARPAALDLLNRAGMLDVERFQALSKRQSLSVAEQLQVDEGKALIARWFGWFQCAFLFGAASGGLIFGWLGDRIGRAKGMAASILTYSIMAWVTSLAQSPYQWWFLWYLACTGVGGMWPNGVALVSEAWTTMSRPLVAGVIGTSANIGILLLSTIAANQRITPQEWRWVLLIAASPVVLGLSALVAVPESPRWLATRRGSGGGSPDGQPKNETPSRPAGIGEVFRPDLLKVTLIGITLATIPMFGGWGSANWMVAWADAAGEAADPPNPFLKAHVNQSRAITGIIGSLLGGWIASFVGRRRTYLVVSICALGIAEYTFWFLEPTAQSFLLWVSALGFFSGIYFGWLPLFLPELFPTRVRSTGAGVSFNFGRILTAITVFATGALTQLFHSNYALIGRMTSLVFLLGIPAICLAPDTSRKQLTD